MNYKKLQEACEKEGCYCPPEYECFGVIANTPMWLRLAFSDEVKKNRIGVEKGDDEDN